MPTGGYLHDTVGEDMELVVRLRRRGCERRARAGSASSPTRWLDRGARSRCGVLARQRDRWHRGLLPTLWRHRGSLFNPRYGAMGMVVYPYFVLVELLAPVVEAVGFLGLVLGLMLGAIDGPFAILFFLFAYGFGMLLSMACILLDTSSWGARRAAATCCGWRCGPWSSRSATASSPSSGGSRASCAACRAATTGAS